MFAAVLRAVALCASLLSRFGSFLLPWLARVWPLVLRLSAVFFGSWKRVITWFTMLFGLGGCEAGLYEGAWSTTSAKLIQVRSFLFGKITEDFPPWVKDLGAFVNTVFPLDTMFSAIALVIGVELSLITLGLAHRALSKLAALGQS